MSKKLKTIFMGTPEFAVDSLEVVNKNTDLKLVITKEDKVNKRGNKIEILPVKQYAIGNNIEYIQPTSLKSEEVVEKIKNLKPDVIIVAAYGKIIPESIISVPKYIINVHSSLLPKYRGASPIHSALINGDKKTGVCIMIVEKTLDTGDVLKRIETEITDEDNLQTLHDRLKKLGAKALSETLKDIEENKVVRTKQDDDKATYAKIIKKEDTKIDFNKSAFEIFNLIRGLSPVPSAFTTLNGKILKILKVSKSDEEFNTENGTVSKIENGKIYVKVNDKSIILEEIQLEGKKKQTAKDAINGRIINLYDILGKEINDEGR